MPLSCRLRRSLFVPCSILLLSPPPQRCNRILRTGSGVPSLLPRSAGSAFALSGPFSFLKSTRSTFFPLILTWSFLIHLIPLLSSSHPPNIRNYLLQPLLSLPQISCPDFCVRTRPAHFFLALRFTGCRCSATIRLRRLCNYKGDMVTGRFACDALRV